MLTHIRLNTAGAIAVLATGATALDGMIDRDFAQAWFAAVATGFLALCWRWALQHYAEAERVAPREPKPERPTPAQHEAKKAELARAAAAHRKRSDLQADLQAMTHAALRGAR